MATTSTGAPWRRDPARWDEPQSGTRQAGQALVVSEICTEGYNVGRAREGGTRGQEGLVGRAATGAAVGMAEDQIALALRLTS